MTLLQAGPTSVIIGPIEQGIEQLQQLARGRPVPLITDERVWRLHGAALADRLAVIPVLLPEGEAAKDWGGLQSLITAFAGHDIDRDTPVVALGGGSIGDVAGLAASLFKRGCPMVHVPTTLLAMCDSAIGGKTAIDAEGQKNLVGSFHPPALVIADPSLLATLDDRQMRAGYAEIVKYGLVDDLEFFAWCEANGVALLAGHRDHLARAIHHCIAAKVRIIGEDIEDRGGRRALLNLGHSFAHAIEAERGLGAVLHGEAVAVGLVLAFRLSARLGLAPPADAERIAVHLAAAGLPTRLADVGLGESGPRILPRLARDKKASGGTLSLVLAHGIGRAFLAHRVDRDAAAAFLAQPGS